MQIDNLDYLTVEKVLYDGGHFYIFSNFRDQLPEDSVAETSRMKVLGIKVDNELNYELLPLLEFRPYICFEDAYFEGSHINILSYAGNGISRRPYKISVDDNFNIVSIYKDSSNYLANNKLFSPITKASENSYVVGDASFFFSSMDWIIVYKKYDENMKLLSRTLFTEDYDELLNSFTFEQFFPFDNGNCLILASEVYSWESNLMGLLVNDSAEILDSFSLSKKENIKYIYNGTAVWNNDYFIIPIYENVTKNYSNGKAINGLRKYDFSGNIIWDTFEECDSVKTICKLIELDNGNLLGVGLCQPAVNEMSRPSKFYMTEYNKNGEKIHEKTWGDSLKNSLSDIIETVEGSFLIIGEQQSYGKGVIYYAKINTKLGISEKEMSNEISIFPNPANDYFRILSSEDANPHHICISDLNGKVISNYTNPQDIIQIGHLPAGKYFVRIESLTFEKTLPLIIER